MEAIGILFLLIVMGSIASFCIGSIILLSRIVANQREQTSLIRKLQTASQPQVKPPAEPVTSPAPMPTTALAHEPAVPPALTPVPTEEPPMPPPKITPPQPVPARVTPVVAAPPPLPRPRSELELAALNRLRMLKNWFLWATRWTAGRSVDRKTPRGNLAVAGRRAGHFIHRRFPVETLH